MMLALGLASVPFFKSLHDKFAYVSVDLPSISSESPLIVSSKYRSEMDYNGGSGPHGPDEPQETINTLGTAAKPHIVKNADFLRARLQNANLVAAQITNSDLSNANLRKANLSKAIINYSGFIQSDLRAANFTETKLYCSDLTGANLSGAKLTRANLAHTDFSNAIFDNADLTDANLSDAELVSAKGLTYEQLSKAIINKYTSLPAKFESKRAELLTRSRQRMKELRNEMSAQELELFSNQFDFLD
jgi:hypothetical protein